MKKTILALFIATAWPFLGHCIDSQDFYQSLKLQQEGKEDLASRKLEKIISSTPETSPEHLASLTNLGLIKYKTNDYGYAMALWRKALSIDPSLNQANRALRFAEKKYQEKHLVKEVSFLKELFALFRNKDNLNFLLALNTFLLFFFLYFTIQFLSEKKKALIEEKNFLSMPLKVYIFTFLFICSSITVIFSFIEQKRPRATVIAKKASVLVTAQKDSPILYEIPEGTEVILGKKKEQWIQVSQSGHLTGWVPIKSLFQTSGKKSLQ